MILGDLSSYRISDFLLFSRETYVRLLELYNQFLWPWQFAIVVLNVTMIVAIYRQTAFQPRWVSAVLALMWAGIGWGFHLKYFSTINIVASYFAGLFFVQALVIFILGGLLGKLRYQRPRRLEHFIGLAVWGYSLFFSLVVAFMNGRQINELQLFGWGTDQTALGTLGILLLVRGRWVWVLPFFLSLVWCLVASLMAFGLKSYEFYEITSLAVLSVMAAAVKWIRDK